MSTPDPAQPNPTVQPADQPTELIATSDAALETEIFGPPDSYGLPETAQFAMGGQSQPFPGSEPANEAPLGAFDFAPADTYEPEGDAEQSTTTAPKHLAPEAAGAPYAQVGPASSTSERVAREARAQAAPGWDSSAAASEPGPVVPPVAPESGPAGPAGGYQPTATPQDVAPVAGAEASSVSAQFATAQPAAAQPLSGPGAAQPLSGPGAAQPVAQPPVPQPAPYVPLAAPAYVPTSAYATPGAGPAVQPPQAGYAQTPYPAPYPYPPYGYGVDPYAKSRVVAGVLGILLGGLGIHRFYLGYVGIGIAQIAVTILTFGVGALWGFIEGILYLTQRTGTFSVDATGRPLRD